MTKNQIQVTRLTFSRSHQVELVPVTFSSILEDRNVLLTSFDMASKFASVLQHQLVARIRRAGKTFVCCDMPLLACLQQCDRQVADGTDFVPSSRLYGTQY